MLVRTWAIWNACTLLVGRPDGVAAVKNAIEVPQKSECRLTLWSSHSTSGHIARRVWSRDLYNDAHSRIFQKNKAGNHPNDCSPLEEWIHKLCSVHMVEYYAAFKREEILSHLQHGSTLRTPVKLNKSFTQGQMLCDSTYMRDLE